ncbi:outer membrane protein assembly factor BamC [Halomonas sp. Mc5H-6]|uniref:outer membrane protein assembly factor BamC n=1 Tax=Halomonas sp. Mc5H-6 TaxID=2954500 RepID=UPI002096BB0D|nr:outer membrane protein assembly factor BamC [Halomonas sp. Mc5H-6]MCO7245406.1 outer membrane protein assembly factor BamC [Halomonas sp. Mc5H-6]
MSSVLGKHALKWIPLALAGAVTLAGCARDEGFYDDRNLDYADVEPASPLVLPETRDNQRYRDALPVPEAASQPRRDGVAEVRPPQPLTVGQSTEVDYVEGREIGDQRWLVVAADPGSVWTQLESFASQRGLDVQESRASDGVLVTTQAEFRLQSGLREGSSEVRCERGGQSMASCLDALQTYLSANAAASQTASATASSWSAQRLENNDPLSLRQGGDGWEVAIPYAADPVWAEIHHYLAQDFDQADERELLAAEPDNHAFLVSYLSREQRDRSLLQVVLFTDTNEQAREVRLVVEPRGDQSVLRARATGEPPLSENAERELLERVASYLR